MAWNRPTGPGQKTESGKKPSRARFVAAVSGVAVILLGGLFLLLRSGESQRDNGDNPVSASKIGTATNEMKSGAIQGNSASPVVARQGASAQPTNATESAFVITSHRDQSRPFRIIDRNKGKKKLFTTVADIYISRVVNTRPGDMLVGGFNYDNFEEKLVKALKTPIVIDPDDTPEEAEKKKAVIEARAELKKLMDRGEDLSKVMQESEAELRKLSNYRLQLRHELAKAMKERKFGANDMQDYVDAANKMLTDNGMEPLKYPQLWVNRLRREEASIEK